MNYEILDAAESIAVVLKDRGFVKEASEVTEAAWGMGQGVGKWTPSMMKSPEYRPSEPSQIGSKEPLEKGELITELDPATGKETVIMWDFKKPMTMDELEDAVKKGYLAVDYFNEQVRSARDPKVKKFFEMLLSKADDYRKQKAISRLSSISQVLDEKGYDALGTRIRKVADIIFK